LKKPTKKRRARASKASSLSQSPPFTAAQERKLLILRELGLQLEALGKVVAGFGVTCEALAQLEVLGESTEDWPDDTNVFDLLGNRKAREAP
jgi:hypothetical protein